jgi:hypothetical protein
MVWSTLIIQMHRLKKSSNLSRKPASKLTQMGSSRRFPLVTIQWSASVDSFSLATKNSGLRLRRTPTFYFMMKLHRHLTHGQKVWFRIQHRLSPRASRDEQAEQVSGHHAIRVERCGVWVLRERTDALYTNRVVIVVRARIAQPHQRSHLRFLRDMLPTQQ